MPLASVNKFAGQNFEAVIAGKELKTDTVLAGNYRFDGENVNVTANLWSVSDGKKLWTESFAVKGKSNFEIETAIALRAARRVSLKIAETVDEKLLADQNLNADAVRNYISARKIWRTGELFRRREMIGLFEKVIELEPNWALAHAGFAEALLTSDQSFFEWEKAEKIAKKAIELDKTIAQPHTILGEIYHSRDWNWTEAENEFKKAAEINADYAPNYFKYAEFLIIQRRFAEAEVALKKAIEIEPFSPVFYASLCKLYNFDNKIGQALEACENAAKIDSDYWVTPKLLFGIYAQRKMYSNLDELILGKLSADERAKHPLTKPLDNQDLSPFFRYLLGEPSKTSGKKSDRPVADAMLYLQMNENKKALSLLETAFEKRDDSLPTVNGDSAFDPIRNEKRFIEIMRKIGLQK